MSQPERIPYVIEAETPDRYPRGWFCIGASHEFTTDTPKKIDYFGSAMVAYRGEGGEMHILDAFCPHMGANLSKGCVKGDSIVCPFHYWSWGADGVCDDIPYAKKIPPKAVIKSWPTMEVNDLVYLWFDPDGGEPIQEQAIEQDPIVAEEGWTPWIIERVQVNVHARELVDNMADKAHFGPVHKIARVTHFSNISEGHRYTQLMNAEGELGKMVSEATYQGPGYMIHHVHREMPDGEITNRSMTLVMNVPNGPNSFEFIAGWKYELPEGMTDDQEIATFCQEKRHEAMQPPGLFSDLEIWQDKCAIDNPVLCDGDGPVTKLRHWYNQFLVPVDQVPASIKERKVYDKSEVLDWNDYDIVDPRLNVDT